MTLRINYTSQNGTFSSQVNGAHQKAMLLDRINALCMTKTDLAYLNFNINTYPEYRHQVWDRYSKENWVTTTENLIPIVKTSRHMKEFEELPIFFVDNWKDVCYNELNTFYERVQDNLYDLDKMKISYWRRRINEKLSL